MGWDSDQRGISDCRVLYCLFVPARTPMPSIVERLRNEPSVIAAELRPPRAELETRASMDAWIDTYHAVRSLTREGTPVFLTDSAVGLKEEDNLRHLVSNLGSDGAAVRDRAVPDLQASDRVLHRLRRSRGAAGIPGAGGARRRQERRAAALRRARVGAARGDPPRTSRSWRSAAGPTRTRASSDQVGHLLDEHATAEFYLTQIVSHHSARPRAPVRRDRGAARPGHPGHVRGLLLPLGEPAHARGARELPAGAGRRAERRVRRGRVAGRDLRADDPRAARGRRAPLLRQQPAAAARGADARAASWRRSDVAARIAPGIRSKTSAAPARRTGCTR